MSAIRTFTAHDGQQLRLKPIDLDGHTGIVVITTQGGYDIHPDQLAEVIAAMREIAGVEQTRERFRVEVHEALDVDVPDGGWSPVTSSMRTLDEAVERMRARRGRCPNGPAMRVVREWTTHTVAASEEPTP